VTDQTNPAEESATPNPAPVPAPTPTPAPIASVSKKKKGFVNPFVWGTGRRKAAVARVRIKEGDGKFLINKREVDKFFCIQHDRDACRRPLKVTESTKNYDVFVNVGGGGITGQAGAVLLGLARALVKADSELEPALREHHLLHRDPRRVERKKYGQRGARRRFQFSKR